MKNILYVDNFNNFRFFLEVAQKSLNCWHFLVFDKRKEKICRERGIKCTLVGFGFPLHLSEKYRDFSGDYIVSASQDRILRCIPRWVSLRILDHQLNALGRLLDVWNFDFVVGEISWGNEYLFYKYCESAGVKYRHLLNLPGLVNRVVFFDQEHSWESLLENSIPTGGEMDSYQVSYYDLCANLKTKNEKSKKNYFFAFFRIFDFGQFLDYRKFQIYYKLRYFVLLVYKLLDRFFDKKSVSENFLKSGKLPRRVLFFPLHIQPECTPDFVSPLYSDQLNLIKQIADALPDDFVLLVKDHPNNISIRNPFRILSLMRHPRVLFVRRNVSSANVMNVSNATLTIAGTIALESSLRGVPCFVYSNIFYDRLPGVYKFVPPDSIAQIVDSGLVKLGREDASVDCYGVEAFVHDPVLFPSVMDDVNLSVVTRYIDKYVENC